MADSLDIANWRACSPKELVAFLDERKSGAKRKGSVLAVRTHLRPADVYAYLRVRFGKPNGLQNMLRRDDSDNLIHWDFLLAAGDGHVNISGASREMHFVVSEQLSDEEWKELITRLKADFGAQREAKSAMMNSFEKYVVFPNKFMALANLCADLHEEIVGAPVVGNLSEINPGPGNKKEFDARAKAITERGSKLWGDALKLRLLTPIMAEAYINMLILTFCRDEVRDDAARYQAVLRERVPERLAALHLVCDGFERQVDTTTAAYATFMRTIASRNFALHGNVDPVREQLETVYFEGKVPLFVTPGHHIQLFFEQLERQNPPAEVIAEYEGVHLFLVELRDYLTPRHRAFFEQVISDSYPGYELRKHRVTRLLPDHVVMGFFEGIRYDDELKVEWN